MVPLLAAVVEINTAAVINPAQYLQRATGQWALNFLLITLCVTPLRTLFPKLFVGKLARYRRQLGLTCFFYASCHFLTYTVLDRNLDLADMRFDIKERPAILLGVLVFSLLIPLALTSSNAAQRYLGGLKWKRLHWLIYPASLLAVTHYLLVTKVALGRPITFILLAMCLLGWRVYRYQKPKMVKAG
jgi:methionine sulfoxide reductase heme-binding subunit